MRSFDPRSRSTTSVIRTEALGKNGMLATKHRLASEAGIEILEAGGNAVDAAVAAALAVGVVEPGFSGIGGGGYMVVSMGRDVQAVSFPMQAPGAAAPDMFELTGEESVGAFEMPGVVNEANTIGPLAIAIPGAIAGMGLAMERFGKLSWAEVLLPAIRLAKLGFELDWFGTHNIALNARRIGQSVEGRKIFLERIENGGLSGPIVLTQLALASTLQHLAESGPSDFYSGDIGRHIVKALKEAGSVLTEDDFDQYLATISPAVKSPFRGGLVHVPPFACAGTTTLQTLSIYEQLQTQGLDYGAPGRLHSFISAAKLAWADRLAYMADPEFVEGPWQTLISREYAAERAATVLSQQATPATPGDPWSTGIDMQASNGVGGAGSTTHLCAADGEGNWVSFTNTLMEIFGSGVVVEGTGVVMNNGMMWFNPRPGTRNSIQPLKRGLNNMSPAIVTVDSQPVLAVGASGGRRITNCVSQIICNFMDFDMSAQDAVSAPRVDCSTDVITIDSRFSDGTVNALNHAGYDLDVIDASYPAGWPQFASPTAISCGSDGVLRGGTDPYHSAFAVGV